MSSEFDQSVLRVMPHPIAVQYQKLLEAETSEQKVHHALCVYELGLRVLAAEMISQYLIRDADRVSDPTLNQLLLTRLPTATLGVWQQILFAALKAYEGKHDLLFMPELYDVYWDSSGAIPRPRPNIEASFTRLTQIRNDLGPGRKRPTNEAGWQALCIETLGLLHILLSQLAFFENCNLIRISRREGDRYWYDQYTGLQVVAAPTLLRTDRTLNPGQFYFTKEGHDFLELHPLLIFWDESRSGLTGLSLQRNVAIYDRFMADRLKYLVATVWETVTDQESVVDFVRLVFYTIEQIKRERQSAERLNWWQLKEITSAISARRMAGAMGKYHTDLYLQRDKAKKAFEDFLESDKVCFILTGKSGVGKSNFLLALAEDYEKRADVCVLMYNGAKLNPKESLTVTVGRDFENSLQMTGRDGEEGISNIWREMGRTEGIEQRKVILCIDAVNENAEAKAVLRQVDELVESSPWPWLKVVVTSRSEAWRVMKRGVQLAEARYYRERGEEPIGIEMEPFSYSQEIEPFTQYELPYVYEKYRQVYSLQTAYADLPTETKLVLRDPLVLRLVADTYREQPVSSNIEVEEVYQKYIDHLIETGRLTQEDIHFLERELMPLMIGDGRHSNAIPDREIDSARTSDGRSLFELIHSDGVLSSGQRVNQSYTNLVDAEILIQHGQASSYEIGFKYERFYDYFAAKRLELLMQEAGHSLAEYQALLHQLVQSPFLWGATQRVLINQLQKNNCDLVIALAYQIEQTSQKMIIEVLCEYGRLGTNERVLVRSILESIMNDSLPTMLKEHQSVNGGSTAAKSVAVETAAQLRIPDVLVRAGDDPNSAVRIFAARRIASVWHEDLETGKKIFHELTSKLTRRVLGAPIPNRRVLETTLAAGILTFAQNHQNSHQLEPLKDVARRGLAVLLPVGLNNPIGLLYNQFVFYLFSDIFLSLTDSITARRRQPVPANLQEIAVYFNRPKHEREIISELLPTLYIESGPLLNHTGVLRRATEVNDVVINVLTIWFLVRRGITEPIETVRLISELFERQITREKPSFHACFMLEAFGHFLTKIDSNSNEYRDLFVTFEQFVKRYIDKTQCRVYHKYRYVIEPLSFYLRIGYSLFRQVDLELVHQVFAQTCHNEDWELLNTYAHGFQSVGTVYPYPVLNSMIPLLQDTREPVVDALARVLAPMRLYFIEEVDDFLANHRHSRLLKDRLTVLSVDEEVGDLYETAIKGFLYDAVTSDNLIDALVFIMGQLPHVNNHREWLSIGAAYMVNLIFQSRIFRVKTWPVDVGHKVISNPFE